MADVTPEQTDGLKKFYESSLGICGFSKGEIAHAWQANSAANPAAAKFLPDLDFHGAKMGAKMASMAGTTGMSDLSALNGAPGLPPMGGDLGAACDPTGLSGLFAALFKFLEAMGQSLPDAEQLLDPSIAAEVAEESAKKLLI